MRHQQQGDILASQRSVAQQEHQEGTPPSLSKGRYKKAPAHCVKAVIQNLPLQGVFSFAEFTPFKNVAQGFRSEFVRCYSEKLVDRLIGSIDAQLGMVLPIQYLPDVLIASPVLYAYKTKEEDYRSYQMSLSGDDRNKFDLFHPALQNICDAFPNQQWRDIVQIFNRVCRFMDRYDGDVIPVKLQNRMEHAAELCDDVFIATPYYDAAVDDLNGVRPWSVQRAKNPYVLGIIRRLPFVVILGRFDEGPLFSQFPYMLADTVEFLRANAKALKALNRIDKHLWYYGKNFSPTMLNGGLGTRLISSVEKMVGMSDKGFLFDWLREGYREQI